MRHRPAPHKKPAAEEINRAVREALAREEKDREARSRDLFFLLRAMKESPAPWPALCACLEAAGLRGPCVPPSDKAESARVMAAQTKQAWELLVAREVPPEEWEARNACLREVIRWRREMLLCLMFFGEIEGRAG